LHFFLFHHLFLIFILFLIRFAIPDIPVIIKHALEREEICERYLLSETKTACIQSNIQSDIQSESQKHQYFKPEFDIKKKQ